MWLLWAIRKYHALKRWFFIAHYVMAPGWDYIKPDLYKTRLGWFQKSDRGKWHYEGRTILFDPVIWRALGAKAVSGPPSHKAISIS